MFIRCFHQKFTLVLQLSDTISIAFVIHLFNISELIFILIDEHRNTYLIFDIIQPIFTSKQFSNRPTPTLYHFVPSTNIDLTIVSPIRNVGYNNGNKPSSGRQLFPRRLPSSSPLPAVKKPSKFRSPIVPCR